MLSMQTHYLCEAAVLQKQLDVSGPQGRTAAGSATYIYESCSLHVCTYLLLGTVQTT
jgi:hypothetical protein